jgi:hypothetical protein
MLERAVHNQKLNQTTVGLVQCFLHGPAWGPVFLPEAAAALDAIGRGHAANPPPPEDSRERSAGK